MKNKSLKYFIVSMFSTFCILALFAGFTIVEKNAQNIICSEPSPFFSYIIKNSTLKSLKIHFMGKNMVFNF